METTNYDVDYFIRKFEAIPELLWCIDALEDDQGRRCALGHCYGTQMDGCTSESMALCAVIFIGHGSVPDINNGEDPRYQQPTPKQRILAALRDIKAKQYAEQKLKETLTKDRIVYVACDAEVRKLGKAKLSVN